MTKSEEQATPDHFVQAMASAAFGVSIVTTQGSQGKFGLTISAVASVSAEPPLVLICINRKNQIAGAVTEHKSFVVNLLSEEQADLAMIFAGRPEKGAEAYDFTSGKWTKDTVVLENAAANFTCRVETFHDAGTHRIFIGQVMAAQHNGALPLVYSHRKFGKFLAL